MPVAAGVGLHVHTVCALPAVSFLACLRAGPGSAVAKRPCCSDLQVMSVHTRTLLAGYGLECLGWLSPCSQPGGDLQLVRLGQVHVGCSSRACLLPHACTYVSHFTAIPAAACAAAAVREAAGPGRDATQR